MRRDSRNLQVFNSKFKIAKAYLDKLPFEYYVDNFEYDAVTSGDYQTIDLSDTDCESFDVRNSSCRVFPHNSRVIMAYNCYSSTFTNLNYIDAFMSYLDISGKCSVIYLPNLIHTINVSNRTDLIDISSSQIFRVLATDSSTRVFPPCTEVIVIDMTECNRDADKLSNIHKLKMLKNLSLCNECTITMFPPQIKFLNIIGRRDIICVKKYKMLEELVIVGSTCISLPEFLKVIHISDRSDTDFNTYCENETSTIKMTNLVELEHLHTVYARGNCACVEFPLTIQNIHLDGNKNVYNLQKYFYLTYIVAPNSACIKFPDNTEYLDLQNCSRDVTMYNLDNLTYLDLSGSIVDFEVPKSVVTLILRDCECDLDLSQFPNLKYLDISGSCTQLLSDTLNLNELTAYDREDLYLEEFQECMPHTNIIS